MVRGVRTNCPVRIQERPGAAFVGILGAIAPELRALRELSGLA